MTTTEIAGGLLVVGLWVPAVAYLTAKMWTYGSLKGRLLFFQVHKKDFIGECRCERGNGGRSGGHK